MGIRLNKFTVVVLSFLLNSCVNSQEMVQFASVHLELDKQGNIVPEQLFGQNIQWTQAGDGFLLEHNELEKRWNHKLIDKAKTLDIPLLRFPGGELANTYVWKNTIGPLARRKAGLNYAGEPEPSLFGLDEFIELCDMLGSQAVITLNLNQSVKEITDLIDYMQPDVASEMSVLRKKHIGDKKCPVAYWEYGNEVYSPHTAGAHTVTEYAAKIKRIQNVLKNKYPHIKAGINYEISFQQAAWMHQVIPSIMSWNQELISQIADNAEFAVLHFYAPFDRDLFADTERSLILAAPEVFEQNIKQFNQLAENKKMPLAVTEYNSYFGSKLILNKRISSTASAVYNAALVKMFAENNVRFANYWSLSNNGEFGLLQSSGEQVTELPMFTVMQYLKHFAALPIIETRAVSPGFNVEAKGNIPQMHNLPVLVSFAVKVSEGRYRLMLLNRSQRDILNVQLDADRPLNSIAGVLLVSSEGHRKWYQQEIGTGVNQLLLAPLSIAFIELEIQ